MTTTLYDSTTATDIPADAPAVAGYIDGAFANLAEVANLHPNKPLISITVTGIGGVRVADVESGDLTPMEGAEWAKSEIAAGRRPTLYYARSTGQQIALCLNGAGVDPLAVDYWVADWTGSAHLITGSAATQYADPATSGGHFDLSEALDSWLSPIPPDPPDHLSEGETMTSWQDGGQNHVVGMVNGKVYHWWQPLGGNPTGPTWNVEELPTP